MSDVERASSSMFQRECVSAARTKSVACLKAISAETVVSLASRREMRRGEQAARPSADWRAPSSCPGAAQRRQWP
jgi:hypothetical protein